MTKALQTISYALFASVLVLLSLLDAQACSVGGGFPVSEVLLCENGSVSLKLENYTGAVKHWEYSTDDGATWQTVSSTSPAYSVKHAQIPDDALFRALVQDGICPAEYSDAILVNKFEISELGTVQLDKNVVGCGEDVTATLVGAEYGEIIGWHPRDLGLWKDESGFNQHYISYPLGTDTTATYTARRYIPEDLYQTSNKQFYFTGVQQAFTPQSGVSSTLSAYQAWLRYDVFRKR